MASSGILVLVLVLIPTSVHAQETITVTHYGTPYNGSPLGCGGYYEASNPTILAVGPSHYEDIPCGATVTLRGPTNNTLTVVRQDSCPGCTSLTFDLSEAANEILCGAPAHTCEAIRLE